MLDSYMNIIDTKTMLKDFKNDIRYAIEKEDSSLNVSLNDIHRMDSAIEKIQQLETKYENVCDKIALTIGLRTKEIGKEKAEDDELCRVLRAILESERGERVK